VIKDNTYFVQVEAEKIALDRNKKNFYLMDGEERNSCLKLARDIISGNLFGIDENYNETGSQYE